MQGTMKICGCGITLYQFDKENRDKYLEVYRKTSNLSELFEKSDELWKVITEPMGTDEDDAVRYIVCIKNTDIVCGIINYEMRGKTPSIDIAIAKEYRQRGFGYDAAKTLCNDILSKGSIEFVYWFVMLNNEPSVKIAKKLGGEQIDGRNILAEAMSDLFGVDVSEYNSLQSIRCYLIKLTNIIRL